MKEARQRRIMEIIARKDVETQNQLLEELTAVGVVCTQATVSRDIRELRLVKELTPSGSYRYAAPAADDAGQSDRLQTIFRKCVVSVDRARNIVVLKTLPGLASAAGSAVDGMHEPTLVGSLAGDDTALLVMRDDESAEAFCRKLLEYV